MTPEWPTLALGDLAARLTTRNVEGNDNVLTISAQHGLVSQQRYFNKRVASDNLSGYFLLERGDFAYNKSYSDGYPVGAIKRLDAHDKGVVSPLYICFRVERNERVSSDYLVHFVEGGRLDAELRAIAKEGARNHGLLNVKPSEFFGLPIVLPPLPEQRKIAAILSSVDDAIESMQAVIDQLAVVKRAMMAELLTRGLPGRHTRFKQTEIGEVPEGWEVVRAEKLFADGPSNGRSPPSKAQPPGVPTFSISAVRGGQVNIFPNLKYADADPASVASALVRRGDILIVRGNGNPELVGRCGVVAEEPPTGCIYPDILMRVRPSGALLPEFLVTLWNSHVIHDQVLDKAKTTNGTYKINGQDVRDIVLPLPPLPEQRLIGELVQAIEHCSRANSAQLAEMQQLKSALMSVLLTGEVRVRPDADAS